MKTFEVLTKIYCTVVVTAEDEEAALEVASDIVNTPSGWDHDETSIDEELTTPEAVETSIRHSTWHDDDRQTEPYTA